MAGQSPAGQHFLLCPCKHYKTWKEHVPGFSWKKAAAYFTWPNRNLAVLCGRLECVYRRHDQIAPSLEAFLRSQAQLDMGCKMLSPSLHAETTHDGWGHDIHTGVVLKRRWRQGGPWEAGGFDHCGYESHWNLGEVSLSSWWVRTFWNSDALWTLGLTK